MTSYIKAVDKLLIDYGLIAVSSITSFSCFFSSFYFGNLIHQNKNKQKYTQHKKLEIKFDFLTNQWKQQQQKTTTVNLHHCM